MSRLSGDVLIHLLDSHKESALGQGGDEVLPGAGELGEVVSNLEFIPDLVQSSDLSCVQSFSYFVCLSPIGQNFLT